MRWGANPRKRARERRHLQDRSDIGRAGLSCVVRGFPALLPHLELVVRWYLQCYPITRAPDQFTQHVDLLGKVCTKRFRALVEPRNMSLCSCSYMCSTAPPKPTANLCRLSLVRSPKEPPCRRSGIRSPSRRILKLLRGQTRPFGPKLLPASSTPQVADKRSKTRPGAGVQLPHLFASFVGMVPSGALPLSTVSIQCVPSPYTSLPASLSARKSYRSVTVSGIHLVHINRGGSFGVPSRPHNRMNFMGHLTPWVCTGRAIPRGGARLSPT